MRAWRGSCRPRDGARVQLGSVEGALHTNETRLRVARANLKAAQAQIEQRLVELYVSPSPDFVTVLAGATSLSDLIDRIEAVNVFTAQDSAIAQQAQSLQRQVSRRETLLQDQRRVRTQTLARLRKRQQLIARDLANERRLLATITKTSTHFRHNRLPANDNSPHGHEHGSPTGSGSHDSRPPQPPSPPPPARSSQPRPTRPPPKQPLPQPRHHPHQPRHSHQPPRRLQPLLRSRRSPRPSSPDTHRSGMDRRPCLGAPSLWGGASPTGFDCSSLFS